MLDTWFSSGLLPFTTLGWPEKTRDLDVFYPNTLLITGFDILFFWVARMIMMGCHFMQGHQQDAAIKKASGEADKKDDSVPFRQVYIHALVRDADRQKMSKTKGNVIDPLEIIERFGTDAMRFTLAAMAAPGTDIAFNESRTDGYRAFANKIWNAARFMFMNVDRIGFVWDVARAPSPAQPTAQHRRRRRFNPHTLEDRWILSRFNRVTADVNDALEDLPLPRSGESHLRLLLGRVLRLVSGADQAASEFRRRRRQERGAGGLCEPGQSVRGRAAACCTRSCRSSRKKSGRRCTMASRRCKSIALAAYPQADEKQFDLAAETEMAILQDLIVSVRNVARRTESRAQGEGADRGLRA